MSIARTHCIERTSPKGGPFIGTCRLCGKPGLKPSQVNEFCPNPKSATAEDAMMLAIESELSDEKPWDLILEPSEASE